jgi:hypothetical protein
MSLFDLLFGIQFGVQSALAFARVPASVFATMEEMGSFSLVGYTQFQSYDNLSKLLII